MPVDDYRILIIEDDLVFAQRFKKNMEMEGFKVDIAEGGEKGLEGLRSHYYDLVVTDIKMPDLDGLELIKIVKQGRQEIDPDVPIVVLTSVNAVAPAVESMKYGAQDYITKESEHGEILLRLRKVLEQSKLINENRYLRDQLEKSSEFRQIVGCSGTITKIKDDIAQIANSDVPVFIIGETGVGKELVARAIHRSGSYKDGPFLDINCASLPNENLLQSELFGFEKGAFTGAVTSRKGKFELAQGGTLFLDEISELLPDSQAKILKAIETLEITRLGGSKPMKINCRLIFATNKKIEDEVEKGRFRRDLYYRINVFPIQIPPLRERREDIMVLAQFFLDFYCQKYQKARKSFTSQAQQLLTAYDWPGNVRELKNIIERLVIRVKSPRIDMSDLGKCGISLKIVPKPVISIPEEGISIDDLEKQLVVEALEKANWNQREAAQLLGLSIDRMHSRIKKFGLKHPSWRVHK